MPVIRHFGLPATARASLGIYNTAAEVDVLVDALHKTKAMFA
jgi:cysteine desulfurase/selenocysteine lyase